MADGKIANSKADFHEEGIKTKPEDLAAIAKTFEGTAAIPSGYLTFFQSVVDLLSKCQKAYKDENYARMRQYVIAVNEAVSEYLKKHGLSSTSLTDSFVDDFLEALEDKLSKKKYVERKVVEEDTIEKEVEDFKSRVLGKIDALLRKKALLEKQTKSSSTKADSDSGSSPALIVSPNAKSKLVDDAFSAAVNVANKALEIREGSFRKNLERFQVILGGQVISNFKNVVSKLTENNLKTFQKNVDRLDSQYQKKFVNVVENAAKRARLKTNKDVNARLKNSGKILLNVTLKTIGNSLRVFFSIAAVVKLATFWGGKLLSVVGKVLRFAVGLALLPLKLLSFTIKTVYNVASFGVKTVKRFVTSTFSLAKTVFTKVSKISVVKFIGKALAAFIMSYPGAYFLGYTMGTIWKMVLNLSKKLPPWLLKWLNPKEDISIVDDVLMPYIRPYKEKIEKTKDAIRQYFTTDDSEKYLSDKEFFKEAVKKKWDNSRLGRNVNAIIENWDDIKIKLQMTYAFVRELTESLFIPAVETLWSILGFFLPNGVPTLTTFKVFGLARLGAKGAIPAAAEFIKSTSFIKKAVKAVLKSNKGAGLLAGALALGAVAIFESFKINKNSDDLTIKERFKKFYNGEFTTNASETRKRFGKYFESIKVKGKSPEKTEEIRQFHFLENTYLEILNEQERLASYRMELKEFADYYDKYKLEGYTLDLNTPWANEINTHNGHAIIDDFFSKFRGIPAQMNALAQLIAIREEEADRKKNTIDKLLEQDEAGENISNVVAKVKEDKLYIPDILKVTEEQTSKVRKNLLGDFSALNFKIESIGGRGVNKPDKSLPFNKEKLDEAFFDVGSTVKVNFGNLGVHPASLDLSDRFSYADLDKQLSLIEKNEWHGISNEMFGNSVVSSGYGNQYYKVNPDIFYLFKFLQNKFPNEKIKWKVWYSRGRSRDEEISLKYIKTSNTGTHSYFIESKVDKAALISFINSALADKTIMEDFYRYVVENSENFSKTLFRSSRTYLIATERKNLIQSVLNDKTQITEFIKYLYGLLNVFCVNFVDYLSNSDSIRKLDDAVRSSLISYFSENLFSVSKKILETDIRTSVNGFQGYLENKLNTPEKTLDTIYGVFDKSLQRVFSDFSNRNNADKNYEEVINSVSEIIKDPSIKERQFQAARQYLNDSKKVEQQIQEIKKILSSENVRKLEEHNERTNYHA